MKKPLFTALAVLVAATGISIGSAHAGGDEPKLAATKSGKDVFCRVKLQLVNGMDQTMQLDSVRISSSTEGKFFSEFALSGSRYRPVVGATVSTPMLDVMVPAGHKISTKVTYRTQVTAGKNPKFSEPKTDESGAGALAQGCSLDGEELTIRVN